MSRKALGATIALVLVAGAVLTLALRGCASRRVARPASIEAQADRPADAEVIARLHAVPLYRGLFAAEVLRSGAVDRDGTIHVEVDLRAALEPRLAAVGFAGASELLPRIATGTIVVEDAAGSGAASILRETWDFEGPSALFDLFDRDSGGQLPSRVVDAIPGAPSAMVRMRLLPLRLADPSFGGPAFASWRDRASFAERLVGRPLRAEIAEDLAGPAVFALYETADGGEAEAVVALELRRSDRLAGLLDILFGLGALTERATVRRYRGVPTGSFASSNGRPGLALAVDGPLFFAATSRARLESAIDARRAGRHRDGFAASDSDGVTSWTAVSRSSFVAHGWARLARCADPPERSGVATGASLRPAGAAGWRLEGHGPAPAITADPILPFLRSVVGGRQREGG